MPALSLKMMKCIASISVSVSYVFNMCINLLPRAKVSIPGRTHLTKAIVIHYEPLDSIYSLYELASYNIETLTNLICYMHKALDSYLLLMD